MPLLGSHKSIAGGYYKAVIAASEQEMQTVPLFTKSRPKRTVCELPFDPVPLQVVTLTPCTVCLPRTCGLLERRVERAFPVERH